MTESKRTLQILGCVALVLIVASVAQAGTITQVTTPFTGSDSFNWSVIGGPGASVTSSGSTFYESTSLTDTVAVTFSDGANGIVYQDNGDYTGGYPVISYLLSTDDVLSSHNSPQTDTLTLHFSTSISEFGVYLQSYDYNDPFNGTITTNSGATFTVDQTTGGAGNQIFLGVQSTSSDISSITFSMTQTAAGGTPDYFVIGPAQFDSTGSGTPITTPTSATPEPSTMVMMAGGLAALAWKARKRVRA